MSGVPNKLIISSKRCLTREISQLICCLIILKLVSFPIKVSPVSWVYQVQISCVLSCTRFSSPVSWVVQGSALLCPELYHVQLSCVLSCTRFRSPVSSVVPGSDLLCPQLYQVQISCVLSCRVVQGSDILCPELYKVQTTSHVCRPFR